jgi:hypothetical protein
MTCGHGGARESFADISLLSCTCGVRTTQMCTSYTQCAVRLCQLHSQTLEPSFLRLWSLASCARLTREERNCPWCSSVLFESVCENVRTAGSSWRVRSERRRSLRICHTGRLAAPAEGPHRRTGRAFTPYPHARTRAPLGMPVGATRVRDGVSCTNRCAAATATRCAATATGSIRTSLRCRD